MPTEQEVTTTRKGAWIQSFTGGKLWPLDLRPEDLEIEVVAHGLSLECRFGKMCRPFYSSAQHSVIVSKVVPERDSLAGLLHDGSDFLLPDLPSPLKVLPEFAPFRRLETKVMMAISERWGVPAVKPPKVAEADLLVREWEARCFMPPGDWSRLPVPGWAKGEIEPWGPEFAELKFLERFRELTTDTNCSACGLQIAVSESFDGTIFDCPGCGAELSWTSFEQDRWALVLVEDDEDDADGDG